MNTYQLQFLKSSLIPKMTPEQIRDFRVPLKQLISERSDSEYVKQAQKFCLDNNVKIQFTFSHTAKWQKDDKEPCDHYNVTIRRTMPDGSLREWVTEYHDSQHNCMLRTLGAKCGVKFPAPTEYDFLACIEKSNPGTFDDFCSDFGYNNDSIKDLQLYQRVCEEQKNVQRMFSDVMEQLHEIQ